MMVPSSTTRAPMTMAERSALKEARRAKQREANAGRAAKMHAARLKLPPLGPSSPEPPAVNVGCSGWFYWHWRGILYPDGMPTKEWFHTYREKFGTVELNAPFYSWPTLHTLQTWMNQTGAAPFVYTVKVSELITHVKRFKGTKTLVRDFGYIADILGERMGCFLFQLPPSFDYSPARLKSLLEQLEPTRRNVVEFRHQSWWIKRVYDAFEESGTIFCSTSAPRLPDVLIKTADDVYIRFHGKGQWYRHNYTDAELQLWKERAVECGAKRIWAYFNNDREGFAIQNALVFRAMLEEAGVDPAHGKKPVLPRKTAICH